MSVTKVLMHEVDCVCRFTTQENDFLGMYGSIFKGASVLLVKEKEGTDNQHYHAYVSGLKKATLDTRIKKHFSGNKLYSCKIVQNSEIQKRYLLKGTEVTKPIVILNSLNVNVEEGWQRFWSDRSNYLIEKKEKKDKGSLVDVVSQRLLEQTGVSQRYSVRNIFNEICIYCRDNNKLVPGDHLMIQYIETIKMRNIGLEALEGKFMRIVDRLTVKN